MDKLGNMALVEHIRQAIRNSPEGSISFRDYMAMCLYHEPYGYYVSDRVKLGREGDFYTSSFVGTLMGDMLAKSMLPDWRALPEDATLSVVEWGAGTGRLAAHVLAYVREHAADCYGRLTYTLVETSPYHRKQQRETLGGFEERVRFRTEPEWKQESQESHESQESQESPKSAVTVLANELLDAFPVYRICRREGRLTEIRVRWNEREGGFGECLAPLGDDLLQEAARQGLLPGEGQSTEINAEAGRWVSDIGSRLTKGKLIVIDYGDTAEELIAPHRMRGTLMCYRRHQAHDDPYIHVGEQDITAHVNFTACLDAGRRAGFNEATLQSQREFLVGAGIIDELREHDARDPFSPASKRNRAIRQLLISDQMSELFKVLVLRK